MPGHLGVCKRWLACLPGLSPEETAMRALSLLFRRLLLPVLFVLVTTAGSRPACAATNSLDQTLSVNQQIDWYTLQAYWSCQYAGLLTASTAGTTVTWVTVTIGGWNDGNASVGGPPPGQLAWS